MNPMILDNEPSATTPANMFFVGVIGDDIVITAFQRRLTRGQAVNLAAWLVALADYETDGGMFRALYEAIKRT